MASKKCPKCGEDNPAEAVMCWACYTPLTGAPAMAVPGMTGPGMAGAAAGTATRGAAGTPMGVSNNSDNDSKKTAIDPKLIGGGAFLVVAGLIAFFVMSSMKPAEEAAPPANPIIDPGTQTPFVVAPPTSNVPSLGPAQGGGGAAPPPSTPAPFNLVAPPNPAYTTGVAGVLSTQGATGTRGAAGLARFVKEQLSRNGKWQNMQVCVFNTQQAADAFRLYQNGRKGQRLTAGDFQQLGSMGVWADTPAFLNSRGNSNSVYNPMSNPTGWYGSVR